MKKVVAERDGLVVVHQHCPDRPYIELEVPRDFGTACLVKCTAESRDQGWTSENIANTWSWFDASVRRTSGRNNLRTIRLFDNRPANPEFHQHSLEIIPNHPWGVNWKPWLKALQPGDVIEMVPRAMYPGWLNIVRHARIELEYDTADNEQSSGVAAAVFQQNTPLYPRRLDASSSEIRVLSIQPGTFSDPITCQIDYAKLDDQGDGLHLFDALSYSWGDAQDYVQIDVRQSKADGNSNPEPVSVTRPAEAALRHLRDESRVLRLWIDIVCINQADNDERAQQVGLMAKIFSRAQTVHVWLGIHPGIEAALLIIRDICNFNDRNCEGGSVCSCQGSCHTAVSDIQEIASQHKEWGQHSGIRAVFEFHYKRFTHEPREYAGGTNSPHIVKLMSHLFENPWFRRVWVIQEVLRARKAFVHCGTRTITWQELTTGNYLLEDRDFTNSEPHVQPSQVSMPKIWSDLSLQKESDRTAFEDQSPSTGLSLQPGVLDVFIASLDLKSKEARDKLYAILSFGKETSTVGKLPAELRPDYDKDLELVFADFTRWWIIEHKSLAILSYVHGNRTRTWHRMLCDETPIPSLPRASWAIPMEGTQRWSQATLGAQFNFRASRNTTPDLGLLSEGLDSGSHRMSLKLLGHRVGRIERISYLAVEEGFKPSDKHQHQLFEAFRKILDPANIQENWKTRRVSDARTNYQSVHSRLYDHLNSHRGNDVVSNVPAMNPFPLQKPARKQGHAVAHTIIAGSCTDPFFFTASNGMIGLCPWRARVGDLISVLHGGNVPFLLRHQQSDNSQLETGHDESHVDKVKPFELVGECFVMGIMDGELVKELEKKRTTPEILTLI